jgi:cytochrome c-type biogenesis protein CcmH
MRASGLTRLARRLLPAATLVAASLAWAQAPMPGAAQAGASAVKPGNSAAPQARPMAADPQLEERVLKIAADLRCLVCQNESIAASRADLANDLRDQVREQLRAGRSEREIREYMVERYGDFVLYTPPVKPATWLLWAGPFVLLGLALVALGLRVRRRRSQAAVAPLSAAEQQRARTLLGRDTS